MTCACGLHYADTADGRLRHRTIVGHAPTPATPAPTLDLELEDDITDLLDAAEQDQLLTLDFEVA